MTENIQVDFIDTLSCLKQEAKDKKISASDGEDARRWAIVYTELEKIYAYVSEYLRSDDTE